MLFTITILQIEILGVSLPWRFIFTREGPGARFYKRANIHAKESNPFSSGTDVNPFSTASFDEKVSSHVQADGSASSWIDLLTGEVRHSDSVSEPATATVTSEGSELLDFLDDAIVQHPNGGNNDVKVISSQEPSESSTEQYINCFKRLAGSEMVCYCICDADMIWCSFMS